MIVIVIIGVVYSLSVNSFQRLSDETNIVTLSSLKRYLQNIDYSKNIQILCLDECNSCDVLVDGKKTTTLDNFVDDSIKVYRYDFLDGFIEKEKDRYFNIEDVEEEVCFSYAITKDGVGEQVLVEFKDKFYDFSTYLENTLVYSSIEEANKFKEDLAKEVMN